MRQDMCAIVLSIGAMLWLSVGTVAVADPVPPELETITVPSTGSTVTSSTVLQSGITYYILAEGTWTADAQLSQMDAEWAYVNISPDENGANPTWDLLVDGVAPDWWGSTLTSPNAIADFGTFAPHTYSPSHIYWLPVVGDGAPIQLRIHDTNYSDNGGSLTASLYEVPEPCTLSMLLFGGLALLRQRR